MNLNQCIYDSFFTNFINHHQVYWLDEMYNLTNGDFVCVLSMGVPIGKEFVLREKNNVKQGERIKELIS